MLDWENFNSMLELEAPLKQSINENYPKKIGLIYSKVLPKLLKIKNQELKTKAMTLFNDYLDEKKKEEGKKGGGKKRRTKKRRTKKRRTKKRRTKKRRTKKRRKSRRKR